MESTNSVKNIEWWGESDGAKQPLNFEWWVMSDEWRKLSNQKRLAKHPLSSCSYLENLTFLKIFIVWTAIETANFYVVLRFVPVGVKFLHNFSLKNSDLSTRLDDIQKPSSLGMLGGLTLTHMLLNKKEKKKNGVVYL